MNFSPHQWPAESLAQELRELNRNYFQNSQDERFAGKDHWPNQQPERFSEELADASAHGITPLFLGDPAFTALIQSATRFNWAVALDVALTVSPSVVISPDGPARISHAILVPGGHAVLAAGEGRPTAFLSNTTGHYKNEAFVLPPVRKAFATLGLLFKR
jgi:hypothetical protein